MKTFLTLLLTFIIVNNSYSQDSTKTKKAFLIAPIFENGILFYKNDLIKQSYGTNSNYYFGVGITFGYPQSQAINPFISFNHSSLSKEILKGNETDEYESHNLTYNQFYFGFKSALYSHKDLIIMSKAAYVHSNVSEQINDFSGTVSGMQIGIGILKQIRSRIGVYLEYSYEKLSGNKTDQLNMDLSKISIGIHPF